MPDNSDDGLLDNPIKTQSENLPDEIIPAKDTETIKPNLESENMEVHHPPQLHHKPKPWKEYFLEFLMIFLAVTLGFFAENIREHYVEKERANEYAQSLYDDLKVDTATIQRTYDEKEWIQSKFDSAEIILASNDLSKSNEFIYYVERYVTLNDIFSPQDVTYQQLRSSGNFRYIKNIALYKNISDYYNLYSRYQSVDGNFGIINKNDLSEIESKLFNVKDLTSLDNYYATNFYNLVLPTEKKLEPLVNDKMSLKLLFIKIDNAKNRTATSKLFLGWLKSSATNLISELKKEYKLI
ncbi:MAG: hypothetical protein EPN39_10510 [Chitinophagaceae bacterium]|nr:MAG: hypothetical protein EPN39_10510 [Chitinophagaceae bacterium]